MAIAPAANSPTLSSNDEIMHIYSPDVENFIENMEDGIPPQQNFTKQRKMFIATLLILSNTLVVCRPFIS
jgi:hypothetical protein